MVRVASSDRFNCDLNWLYAGDYEVTEPVEYYLSSDNQYRAKIYREVEEKFSPETTKKLKGLVVGMQQQINELSDREKKDKKLFGLKD